ncbi:30S ribosomal protein S5 [Candidatus Woesearchaeota archaeon]|nr:30S ribosomal protein S5 [Candidatus Woesearchaeota archaeon]
MKAEEENKYKKRFAGKGGRNRRNTRQSGRPAPVFDKEKWAPRTALGKKVKLDEIKNIDEILDKGLKFIEPEIMDCFFPGSEAELLLVGQSKGKFGGGQKRVFKQTQKKTREGNKPKFATIATIGNKDGYVGIGYGKSKETVPAREKAIREAKLSLIKIRRGCGSWECSCKTAHSIPFKVKGKCGSVILTLMPAPKGTGLCVSDECKKLLSLAGVEDVWSSVKGKTTTKTNMINACFSALKQLMNIKIKPKDIENLGIIEGNANK